MEFNYRRLAVCAIILATAGVSSAQYFSQQYEDARWYYGVRHYSGYPYHWSTGLRYDPYWSYNSSYFPQTYHGDGSYYGIGYSGGSSAGYYYW